MERLGTQRGDVMSLSASCANDTSFASLSSDATVALWDVRLKRRQYMTIPTASRAGGADATEVLFAPDHHLVVALCDREVRFVDVRHRLEVLSVHTHTSEVVGIIAGGHCSGRRTTLVVDEEGCIVPLDLAAMQPTTVVEEWVFGSDAPLQVEAATAGAVPGFGQLSNYCCGLGLVDIRGGAADEVEEEETAGGGRGRVARGVVAVGMDGRGELHRSPNRAFPWEVDLASLSRDGAVQMVNPPLPACCGFHRDRVAIGKADGTYEVMEVAPDGISLDTLMAAPGHARNGLCVVHWVDAGRHLLTVSLCGEATLWDVDGFLADEEGEDGDLPTVLAALDQRECVGSAKLIVNAGAELCNGQFLLGDNEGNVTLCRLD